MFENEKGRKVGKAKFKEKFVVIAPAYRKFSVAHN